MAIENLYLPNLDDFVGNCQIQLDEADIALASGRFGNFFPHLFGIPKPWEKSQLLDAKPASGFSLTVSRSCP